MTQQVCYMHIGMEGFDPSWQHVVFPVSLYGTYRPERVAECLRTLRTLNPIARARLAPAPAGGAMPTQRAAPADDVVPPVVVDGTDRAAAARAITELVYTPFDLVSEGGLRVAMAIRTKDVTDLVFIWHHVFIDRAGAARLVEQFLDLYAGRAIRPVDAPGASFFDYVADERRAVRDGRFEAALGHWRAELDGASTLLPPAVRGHEPGKSSLRSAHFVGGPDWSNAWSSRCGEIGISPSVMILGAVAYALQRVTGADDIVLQVLHDLRRGRFRRAAGEFADMLFVRSRESSTVMTDAGLRDLQRTVLAGLAHPLPALHLYENLPEVFSRWAASPDRA
jgi:hypothetical protein